MTRERLSATIDAEVLAAVRSQVGPRGLSEFVNRALRFELERQRLTKLVDRLQEELGPPTDEELAWAAEALGAPTRTRRGAA